MELVNSGNHWDHAKWLFNKGGLLIEVGGDCVSGWTLGLALLAGI